MTKSRIVTAGMAALVFGAVALTAAGASSDELVRGESLYNEMCRDECHKSTMFDIDNRQAENREILAKWVHNCAEMVEAGWTDEQKADVVTYMAVEFYGF